MARLELAILSRNDIASCTPCRAAITSGQSSATPRSTAGCPPGRISVRNCSGVGVVHSAIRGSASVRDELISVPFAPAGVDAFGAEHFDVRLEALRKLWLVPRSFRPPRDLRERQHAGESHELQIALR